MKGIIFVLSLLIASRVSGDDLALAKEAFGKFAEYQKENDPRILDLVAADCSGRVVQSDGSLEIVTLVPPGQFRAGIEAGIKKKEGHPDAYEEVAYKDHKDSIAVSGFIQSAKSDFRGPFQMTFKKDKAGAMKLSHASITFPLGKTPIKADALFEFVMPGEWKAAPIQKMDLGNGRTLHIGRASSKGGSLGYNAFEDRETKPEDHDIKEFHWAAIEPVIRAMKKNGAKEQEPFLGELTPGNKDQVYFIYPIEGPDKSVMRIRGITLRTKARIYTIFSVEASTADRELWQEVAKSFKEL
ncbi:hypothetical protein [Luteolibacter luteus]|uniref:Uncharacterized protein n=1 Tax=Luteolibacter luteus TaxID=2728835 RepID=A0A858RRQ6_9BACT|nr:hypothetical protein [Luteolibacter luteus]QJE99029.1 hypothetical protein HHL09_25700 [Luteolibacter luteus]